MELEKFYDIEKLKAVIEKAKAAIDSDTRRFIN